MADVRMVRWFISTRERSTLNLAGRFADLGCYDQPERWGTSMSIDDKDFWHGAALVAIADSKLFTALNKSGEKYGHYVVNHDRDLLIKYATKERRGGGGYQFTFSPHDVAMLNSLRNKPYVFIVFVCGHEVVTALSLDELETNLDLSLPNRTLFVHAQPNKGLRFVSGSTTSRSIPRQRFPGNILMPAK